MIRIGIDVGGTFTDLVCWDEASGRMTALKVPSTTGAEHQGFAQGIAALGMPGESISQIVHGTTVATNTLLQRVGIRVALLTTEGFRDVLEIGRSMRYSANSLFDSKFVKPAPLVERPMRAEIRERVSSSGEVLVPLDAQSFAQAEAAVRRLKPESVAVCFLNSYASDVNEQAIKEHLQKVFPGMLICTSREVFPGFQEFERFSTAALNAYLMPSMARYLDVLGAELKSAGVVRPILLMGSGGGAMTPKMAAQLPVRTILSGPVGGVNASLRVMRTLEVADAISYDMGGTSTDVSVIRNYEAVSTQQTVYGGMPVRGSMIEINTVGAGAGSIAFLSEDGMLQVGPESAGGVPGPACYGAGGQAVTVSDANLLLGRLNADRALGGRIRLNRQLAEHALCALAVKMSGMTAIDLAEGIIRIAVAKMVGAIREISVSRGIDPRRFCLMAYGGAGPMHAAFVARELGIGRVIVPQLPGNFSALGLLTSEVRWELVETLFDKLGPAGFKSVDLAIRKLREAGVAHMEREGFDPAALSFEIWVDMHYSGQASQFGVKMSSDVSDDKQLKRLFLERYEERYGQASQNRAIEIDAVRLITIGRGSDAKTILPVLAEGGGAVAQGGAAREVYFSGKPAMTPVFERAALGSGTILDGPAIIEEPGATTVVPPGWRITVERFGNLLLTMDNSAERSALEGNRGSIG